MNLLKKIKNFFFNKDMEENHNKEILGLNEKQRQAESEYINKEGDLVREEKHE